MPQAAHSPATVLHAPSPPAAAATAVAPKPFNPADVPKAAPAPEPEAAKPAPAVAAKPAAPSVTAPSVTQFGSSSSAGPAGERSLPQPCCGGRRL